MQDNDKKSSECVFCEMIQADIVNDTENLILLRREFSFLVLNRYPYNSGHLMVLPNTHEGDLTKLKSEEQSELMHLTSFGVELLRRVYNPMAFNVGINMGEVAGGSLAQHLHVHIVPRWQGDTNFMPVIGETKTLPEELHVTYERLLNEIEKDKIGK